MREEEDGLSVMINNGRCARQHSALTRVVSGLGSSMARFLGLFLSGRQHVIERVVAYTLPAHRPHKRIRVEYTRVNQQQKRKSTLNVT